MNFDPFDNRKSMILKELQEFVNNGLISVLKMDDIASKVFRYYEEIDGLDSRIQIGDKVALAAFCADKDSVAFYTNDSNSLKSIKIQEYMHGLTPSKAIREP